MPVLPLRYPNVPELPEVEITRRGIEPHVAGRTIIDLIVREPRLRWPVPKNLRGTLAGRIVDRVRRRAKYLLFDCGDGTLIVHLGMSGSLRLLAADVPPGAHDHVDLVFKDGLLRLRDPRRFGSMLWQRSPAEEHVLLRSLGVEPLDDAFSGAYLHRATRGRRVAIKLLLMNQAVVVGVGNIYANESLFRAGILPRVRASRLSLARCERLVAEIKATLLAALAAGGSTLRDFHAADGAPGYFQQSYFVYDRQGQACRRCGEPIKMVRLGQRSTFYCAGCQR